jgi:hypothetical protein
MVLYLLRWLQYIAETFRRAVSELYAVVGVKTTVFTTAWSMHSVKYATLYIKQPDPTVCVCVCVRV